MKTSSPALSIAWMTMGVMAFLATSGRLPAADEVWFEDSFATPDGKPADYPGFKDPQTQPLPHAKGVGGEYQYSAYAHGWRYDGYVLLGATRGMGLAAKLARVQTTKTWRLADVPAGKILRFEMKGVILGQPKRAEGSEGFGLSDNGAGVHHLKDVNNIIWTFYRPGKKIGFVRPYVQWTGNRYSAATADIQVPLSTDPTRPDDFVIEYRPDRGVITFLHSGESVYQLDDANGIAALADVPLAMVFTLSQDNIETIEIDSWSLRLVEPTEK